MHKCTRDTRQRWHAYRPYSNLMRNVCIYNRYTDKHGDDTKEKIYVGAQGRKKKKIYRQNIVTADEMPYPRQTYMLAHRLNGQENIFQ